MSDRNRKPKRYPWQILLGALFTVILGIASLLQCGSGDGADDAWKKPGVYDKTGELLEGLNVDGGTGATKEQ